MATTMTFTTREMTVLRAALTTYEENRRDQSRQAEDAGEPQMCEFFDRHADDARYLYARVFYACDTDAEARKAKAAA